MIIIIDTSIFLNILNVPNRNQEYQQVTKDFEKYIKLGASFILPIATVIETGNHIAQNGDGTQRRKIADKFCKAVTDALTGEAPYTISPFPSNQEIQQWLNEFPDLAGKNKSDRKLEGTSLGDLTIIKEFEKIRAKHGGQEIMIWTLDSGFESCYHKPA